MFPKIFYLIFSIAFIFFPFFAHAAPTLSCSGNNELTITKDTNITGDLAFTGRLTSGIVPLERLDFGTANECFNNQFVSKIDGNGVTCTAIKDLSRWALVGNDISYTKGNVGIGTSDMSGMRLRVEGNTDLAGNVYINKNGNGALITRHIDGKKPDSSDYDNLYLQYSTGKNVNIGGGATSHLTVHGDVGFTGMLQSGSVPWERLTSLPGTCPGGQFVTGISGSLTCATVPIDTTSSVDWSRIASKPTIPGTGSCSGNTFVKGISSGSPTCGAVPTDTTSSVSWSRITDKPVIPVSVNEFGFALAPLTYVGDWNNGAWWEAIDRTDDLHQKGVFVSKVVLTVVAHEAWDWPAVGTQYSFGDGFLSFNQEHVLYNAHNNILHVTINTGDSLSIGGFNVKRINSIRVRSEDLSARDGGVIFHISYEGLVLKHISSGLISTSYLK